MPGEIEGQIDTEQKKILELKGSKEARENIAKYQETFIGAVDTGQKELLRVYASLTDTPEAQQYVLAGGNKIQGLLTQMAETGRQIIAAHEKNEARAAPSLESLASQLRSVLTEQKTVLESYVSISDFRKTIKKLKTRNDTVNKSPATAKPADIYTQKTKIKGEYGEAAGGVKKHQESAGLYATVLTEGVGLQGAVEQEMAEAQTAMGLDAKVNEYGGQMATLARLLTEHQKNPERPDAQDVYVELEKCRGLATAFEEAGAMTTEWGQKWLTESLQKRVQETDKKYPDLLTKAAEKVESVEPVNSMIQLKALQEEIAAYDMDFKTYEAEVARFNAKDPEKISDEERDEFLGQEQGLLQMYITARGFIQKLQSSEFVSSDRGTGVAVGCREELQKVATKIQNIETYKTQRQMNKGKYSYCLKLERNEKGELEITIDGEKVKESAMRVGEGLKPVKVIVGDKEVEIPAGEALEKEMLLDLETRLSGAKEKTAKESKKIEEESRKEQGDKAMEGLKEDLGEKGADYFVGMEKFAEGDFDSAHTAFVAYVSQSFTDEEKETHAPYIKIANERIQVHTMSATYYDALGVIDSDEKAGSQKLAQYIAEVEKLPKEEQALHEGQIEMARETIRRLGAMQLNQLDDLMRDVSFVRGTRTSGNLMTGFTKHNRMSPSEDKEYTVLSEGIEKLREQLTKNGKIVDENGQTTDIYTAIEELKAKVHQARQEYLDDPKAKGYKATDSMMDEIWALREGLNSGDPEVRKKTAVEFAKKARTEEAYDIAREYLDRALAARYKEYDDPKKVDSKKEVRYDIMHDDQAVKDIRAEAGALFKKMEKEGSLLGLSLGDIEARLIDRRVEDVYKGRQRKAMIGDGLAETDEAMKLYESWFPHKESTWWKPWTYGAAEWDHFEGEVVKFGFETVATFGIGMGAGAAGKAVGGAVLRALARRGFSEAAIAAVEKGGVTVLRQILSKGGGEVLAATVAHGVPVLAVEGGIMFGAGTFQSAFLDYETTMKMLEEEGSWGSAKQLGLAIAKAGANKVFGSIGNRFLGENPGMVRKFLEWTGSGAAGIGMEYGLLEAEGKGNLATSQWVFRQIFDNAVQAGGVHFGRRFSGEIRGTRSAAGETEKTARAIDTHYFSRFSGEPPKDLWPEPGKPESAKRVAGWIDEGGQIHYNSQYFEKQYGVKMAEKDGKNVFIVGGKEMTPMEYFRTAEGKEVLEEMKRVKDHEVTHRILEAAGNTSGGKLAQDMQKLIEGNPRLIDAFKKAGREMNPKNIQEFLCEVADGRVKLSSEEKAAVEGALGEHVEGFNFDGVRRIDTRLLSTIDAESLIRAVADAMVEANAYEKNKSDVDYYITLLKRIGISGRLPEQIRSEIRKRMSGLPPDSSKGKVRGIMDGVLREVLGSDKDYEYYMRVLRMETGEQVPQKVDQQFQEEFSVDSLGRINAFVDGIMRVVPMENPHAWRGNRRSPQDNKFGPYHYRYGYNQQKIENTTALLERPLTRQEYEDAKQRLTEFIKKNGMRTRAGNLAGDAEEECFFDYDYKMERPEGGELRKAYISPPIDKAPEYLSALLEIAKKNNISWQEGKSVITEAAIFDAQGNMIGQNQNAVCFYFSSDADFKKFVKVVADAEKKSGVSLLQYSRDKMAMYGQALDGKINYGLDLLLPESGNPQGTNFDGWRESLVAAAFEARANGGSRKDVIAAIDKKLREIRGVGIEDYLTLNPLAKKRADEFLKIPGKKEAIKSAIERHLKGGLQFGIAPDREYSLLVKSEAIRKVAEEMGVDIRFDGQTGTVFLSPPELEHKTNEFLDTPGKRSAIEQGMVDGHEFHISADTQYNVASKLIAIRKVASEHGFDVEFDATTNIAVIRKK